MVGTESFSMHDFLDGKKKSSDFPSKKKLRVHLQQGDQINHGTGKWVFKERRVDKDQGPSWYFERVTDIESGEVIHETSESLADHTGHGSDKSRNTSGDA